MTEISHRQVTVNGLTMHIAEAGQGPLVLLLHGFPEFWYSWRHQLLALARAGFHAVAPDQRGYGDTDKPLGAEHYTAFHLAGDAVALIGALGERDAVVVGHDWGSAVASCLTLLRPGLVRGLACLSLPPRPRGSRRPTDVLRAAFGEAFYQLRFQERGLADAELAADTARTFRAFLHYGSGQAPRDRALSFLVDNGPGALAGDVPLPSWATPEDVDAHTRAFADGFTPALNWYRNIDRNWELTAPWQGARLDPPMIFLAGRADVVLDISGSDWEQALRAHAPRLRSVVTVPGAGHWVQQEAPERVSAELVEFATAMSR